MTGWRPYNGRTVIRSQRFEAAALAIQPNAVRCDEMLEAAEWAIAHNPGRYPSYPIQGTTVWAIKVEPPPMTAYYTIDEQGNTCTLEHVALR
jgi:hypothetical protein